jgi:hypothetical protein
MKKPRQSRGWSEFRNLETRGEGCKETVGLAVCEEASPNRRVLKDQNLKVVLIRPP